MSLSFANCASQTSVQAFLAKMELDADFFLQVGEAKSPVERWNLIRHSGFDFSREDLAQAMGDLDTNKAQSLATRFGRLAGSAAQGDIPKGGSRCGTCE